MVGDRNAVAFEFTFEGAQDNWMPEAKAALDEAADAIAAYIVVRQPVTLTFKVNDDPNETHLAQAASDRVETEKPGYLPHGCTAEAHHRTGRQR
jgi:hypothetical protein